jgi:hypothetical protein
MIVEDEKESSNVSQVEHESYAFVVTRPASFSENLAIAGLIVRNAKLHDKNKHSQLAEDLVEHLWMLHGEN